MKSRIRIAELILALVFIAATASAASYKPIAPKNYECLIFELELTRIHGIEVTDEKGSKYVHVDFVPFKTTQVFYYVQTAGGRFWQSWQGKVGSNSKSLNGSGESRQAIMVMNAREGSTGGYIVFVMDIPKLDAFTPSVQCHLSGTFDGAWDENEQRYIVKEGRGVVAGHSTQTKWAAWDFLEQAAPSIQSPMSPAWGSFTVRRAILTSDEIINLIK